jgi:adenylate kinase family enzyme
MRSPASLIVIGGFAGSGKSTLAKKLGNAFSIPVFELTISHVASKILQIFTARVVKHMV